MKHPILCLGLLLMIGVQPLFSQCSPQWEIFGRGAAWDRAFADSALLKFNALRPDTAWERKLRDLGDDSWLSCDSAGGKAAAWVKPYGHDEVPMAHVPGLSSGLLNNGCGGPGYSSSTWLFHMPSNTWVQMWPNWVKSDCAATLNLEPYPTDRPAGRCSIGLCYDSDRGLVVNHGGANAGNEGLVTFAWNPVDNSWTKESGGSYGPPCAEANNMGFIPGFGAIEVCNSETWVYRPLQTRWEKLVTVGKPLFTQCQHMVWASKERRLILVAHTELWSFNPDSLTWRNITPTSGDPQGNRYRTGVAYDSLNNVILMYGSKGDGTTIPERGPYAYSFADRQWHKMGTSPGADNQAPQMTYDPKYNVCLIRTANGKWYAYRYRKTPVSSVDGAAATTTLHLFSARPNPFNSLLSITFYSAAAGRADMRLFDATGRCVRSASIQRTRGSHEERLNTAGLPAGLYMVRVSAEGRDYSRTAILMK